MIISTIYYDVLQKEWQGVQVGGGGGLSPAIVVILYYIKKRCGVLSTSSNRLRGVDKKLKKTSVIYIVTRDKQSLEFAGCMSNKKNLVLLKSILSAVTITITVKLVRFLSLLIIPVQPPFFIFAPL